MTNAELIAALRYCAEHEGCDYYIAKDCPREETWVCGADCEQILMRDAADALEADEKRIAELMPKRGEWIEKWRFRTDGTPFHKIGDMECSVCHGDMLGRYYSKYCPHCGALLRGENDERSDKA